MADRVSEATLQGMRSAIRAHAAVVLPAVCSEEEIERATETATIAALHAVLTSIDSNAPAWLSTLEAIAAPSLYAEVRMFVDEPNIIFSFWKTQYHVTPAQAMELLQTLAWGLLEAQRQCGDQTLRGGESK